MLTFAITLAVFVTVVSLMAVGMLFAGKRLKGSCGGKEGAACACDEQKRRRCKEKPTPHADTPVEVAALTRRGTSASSPQPRI